MDCDDRRQAMMLVKYKSRRRRYLKIVNQTVPHALAS